MKIGVPLIPGTDPLALGLLERMVAQADAELALAGDPRRLSVVRVAAEPGPVALWGGARVTPDVVHRERPGLDVLVLLGAAVPEAVPDEVEESVLAMVRAARSDAQHVLATGGGILWAMRAGITTGRRVVMDQLPPRERARFDATLAARTDPARDGDLWTASDPPRFALLLLEFFADLGGFRLADRVTVRLPWLMPLISSFAPAPRDGAGADWSGDGDDDASGGDGDGDPAPRTGDVTATGGQAG